MTINLTGTVLSNILFEHSNSVCDKEGLLLGKISKITTDTISDSSLNNVEHQTVYYLHSFVPCDKLFSWYNCKGEVQVELLKTILDVYKPENVIGWYKLRRNSSLTPSVRERAIHRRLEEWMTTSYHRDCHLVFFLCVSQSTFDGALYTSDHQFMTCDGRKFLNMPVTITNLGNIAKPNYQTSSNFTCSIDSSYSLVLNELRSDFVNGVDELASVKKVETLKFNLQEKLKGLSEKLIRSDAEVGKEMAEVRRLRTQLQSAEGFKASPSALSGLHKSGHHGREGLHKLQSKKLEPDEVFMEVDSVKTEVKVEEKHLIDFDTEDDDDKPQGNLTQTNSNALQVVDSNSPSPSQTYLIHKNNEAMNAICISDGEERKTTEDRKTTNVKHKDAKTTTDKHKEVDERDMKPEKPFEFLNNIVEMHTGGGGGGNSPHYALRSRPTVEPENRDVGRTTRRTRAMKEEQMDWETTTKSQVEENAPQSSSRKNIQKVYEREDN